ncbi:MAG: hypothetical protein ACM31H_00625 [Nitrososphaerales archaeon]
MKTTTFSIPTFKMVSLMESMKKLESKAIKLGIMVPVIIVKDTFTKKVSDFGLVEFTNIDLISTELKYGNYEFLGTIDHSEGFNVVKVIPGKEIPKYFWESDCSCDHCNVNRYRTETFVFKSGSDYKKVGRTCLKEFFGIDPIKEIEFFESVYSTVNVYSESEFGGLSDALVFSSVNMVALALGLINDFGYVSKKMAMESDKEPTSSLMASVLFPGNNKDSIEFSQKYINKINGLVEKAESIITWGQKHFVNPNNEYEFNMKNILDTKIVSTKLFGYLISIIPTHYKATVEKSDKLESNYIGSVGDKIVISVKISNVIACDSYYGTTYIHKMSDVTGNVLVWMTNKQVFDANSEVTIKATIKEHTEYNGTKQTTVLRVKAV